MLTRRQKWKRVMKKTINYPVYVEPNCFCMFCNCMKRKNSEIDTPQQRKIKFLNRVIVYEYSPCLNDNLWWKESDYIDFRNNNLNSPIDDKYNTI